MTGMSDGAVEEARQGGVPDRGDEGETVFDPIENKESWSRLLGKRVPPRCEHDEPCISLLTKKPGINRGESLAPMSSSLPGGSPRPPVSLRSGVERAASTTAILPHSRTSVARLGVWGEPP